MDQRAASGRPLPCCVEALKTNKLLRKPSPGKSCKLHANLNVCASLASLLTCAITSLAPQACATDPRSKGPLPPPSLDPLSAQHVISLTRHLLPSYCYYRYWQVIQRLVLIGWTDDARDLLYVHSETQSTEDRQSMQAEVLQLLCSLFMCQFCLVIQKVFQCTLV